MVEPYCFSSFGLLCLSALSAPFVGLLFFFFIYDLRRGESLALGAFGTFLTIYTQRAFWALMILRTGNAASHSLFLAHPISHAELFKCSFVAPKVFHGGPSLEKR